MEGVTKGQQRLLTIVGGVVGIVAGLFAWDQVINDQMIEAPRFVLAVFVGGAVAMFLYVLIHDGGLAVLRKQAKNKAAPTDAGPAPAPTPAPAPAPPVEDEDTFEDDDDAAPQRPLRARERPLRPRNRG